MDGLAEADVSGFIVVVIVIVGSTMDGVTEAGGVITGHGVDVEWVTRIGWCARVGLQEAGQFWWW